jgi:hypothetical protein
VLVTTLRFAIGRWSSEFIRDSLAPRGAVERIHGRLAKFRLSSCCTDSLRAASALLDVDPVLVSAKLRDRLAASLNDTLAIESEHVPQRVRQLVEETWPQFLETFADEVIAGGAPMRPLAPVHHARVEYADAHGTTGAESFKAITRAMAQLERRGVDPSTIECWRTRRLSSGELIAEPRLTVAALLWRMRERRLRDQKTEF